MLSEPSESMELTVFDSSDPALVARVLSVAAYEGLAIVRDDELIARNSQFAELARCDRTGRVRLSDCFGPEEVQRIRDALDRGGLLYSDRVLCERDDDEWLEVRFRSQVAELPDGHSVLVLRDVTDEVRADHELRRAKADLEQFAYVASHDLKSPLRGIANLATWIREDLAEQLSGQTAEYFQLLDGRIHRMETLLEDLLAYSRAGRTKSSTASIWIDEFIDDVVDFVAPPDGFEVNVQSDHVRVVTTPIPLRTVIQNLVQNVFKHHDEEEGQLLIAVAIDTESDELLIEVEDDGPGIPERFHDKIFAIFETLRPRDEVEGSGIGLALVRRLVEDAGGVIVVQSPVHGNRGTCFRLSWPLINIESPQ